MVGGVVWWWAEWCGGGRSGVVVGGVGVAVGGVGVAVGGVGVVVVRVVMGGPSHARMREDNGLHRAHSNHVAIT